jgi:hypothetical protein
VAPAVVERPGVSGADVRSVPIGADPRPWVIGVDAAWILLRGEDNLNQRGGPEMTETTRTPISRRQRLDLNEPGVGGRQRGEGLATALPAEADDRLRRIQETAYFKAQRRAFVPGYELDDWLAAEREITGTHAEGGA